jgi:hypothetical protein
MALEERRAKVETAKSVMEVDRRILGGFFVYVECEV